MIYIIDSNSLINIFKHIYRKRFPSFWEKFDGMVEEGEIISAREVFNEISEHSDDLAKWAKSNKSIFKPPNNIEMDYVTKIYSVKHFQANVRKQEILKGKPVADPFVIAKAWALGENGCVVTEERKKSNAAKIPNICDHFDVSCINFEEFMEREKWEF